MEPKIVVWGSLNPDKECQDRVRVLSGGGICQAVRATDYKDPPKVAVEVKNDAEPILVGGIGEPYEPGRYYPGNRIYDSGGIAVSHTAQGVGRTGGATALYRVEEPIITAVRGRTPDNPASRQSGLPTQQMLEIKDDGTSNTLTTVQKDILVIEPTVLTPKRTEHGKAVRKAYESGEHHESRHTMTQLEPKGDGTSNTLTTVQKDNLVVEPLAGQFQPADWDYNQKGEQREERFECRSDCVSNAVLTHDRKNCIVEPKYRVRKLTPLECWRLMGFSDEDFSKAKSALNKTFYRGRDRSNSQLYKQAGNSIVVTVLEAILGQMT